MVKRYDSKTLKNCVMPYIGEVENGYFVKYEDYQILESKLKEAVEALGRFKTHEISCRGEGVEVDSCDVMVKMAENLIKSLTSVPEAKEEE